MVRSAESVVIDKSVDEVFRSVADLRNEAAWHEDIAAVPADTDPVPVLGRSYPVKFKPFLGGIAPRSPTPSNGSRTAPGSPVPSRCTRPVCPR